MKAKTLRFTTVLGLLVALAVRVQVAAQDKQDHGHKHHRYKLIDLGTLGGTASYFQFGPPTTAIPTRGIVNSRRTFTGWADTSTSDPFPAFCFITDCLVTHAFQWRKGSLTDLGALTGEISSAANWISANDLIAGISENGDTDPLYAGLPEVRAVLWQQGKITDLGTLGGGYESYAAAVNSRGQVVGAALNTTPDTNSMQPGTYWLWGGISPPYQYQTRAFLWDQQKGMQDLGTLAGTTDAQAILINEPGQVVGYSYINSNPSPACAAAAGFALTTGSFVWDQKNGMENLGGLGGTCTLASDLSNRGQVVGTSNLKGDRKSHAFLWQRGMKLRDLGTLGGDNSFPGFLSETGDIVGKADLPGPPPQNHHAILWRNGEKIDLGVLKGDSCSRAYGVNSSGQVVGNSESEKLCDVSGEHAFVWEDGQMTALDDLIPSGSSLKLSHAFVITDSGEIGGLGVPPGCARSQDFACGHAYVLIPCDESNHESCGEQEAEPPTTQRQLLDTQPLPDEMACTPSAAEFITDPLWLADNANSSRQSVSLNGAVAAGRCIPKGQRCRAGIRCCPGSFCCCEGFHCSCQSQCA